MKKIAKKLAILGIALIVPLIILDRFILSMDSLRVPDNGQPARRFTEAGMFVSVDDPLRHFGLRPSVTLTIAGRTYRHDSLGLRDDEVVRPKPQGLFRILVIGDSYTYGWGVDQAESIPEQMAAALNGPGTARNTDIINAGVPAYDTAAEYAFLRDLVPIVEPDLVVLVFQTNDITKVDHFYLDEFKTFYACDLPMPYRLKVWLKHSPLYHLSRRAYTKLKTRLGFEWFGENEWPRSRDYLDRIAALCARRGLPLFLVNLPHLQVAGSIQFTKKYTAEHPEFSRQSEWVDNWARGHELPFVDILGTLRHRVQVERRPVEALYVAVGELADPPQDEQGRPRWKERPDHHLDAAGCRLVANEAVRGLREAGLLPQQTDTDR